MTVAVRRAVDATLDRLRDNLDAPTDAERAALAALTEDERLAYDHSVSNAHADEQLRS